VTVTATAVSAYDIDFLAHRRVDADDGAPLAFSLLDGDAIARIGIPPSARIVQIDGRPASDAAQARRVLRVAGRSLPLLIALGETRYFVALDRPR
jgi:hypothetical protein